MLGAFVAWPAPPAEPPSPAYTVTVNDAPVFVYAAAVRAEILKHDGLWTHRPGCPTQPAAFALFDTRAPVTVTVRPTRPFRTATVLPHRAGITPDVTNGCVRFTVQRPEHLTVLLDDSDRSPLHLFIGEPETDVPRPGDPGVTFFGPGVHEIETLDVRDGQFVYLAGGAVVKARLPPGDKGTWNERWKVTFHSGTVFNVNHARGVRICGRGILDGSLIPHPGRNLIRVAESTDVRIEGIVLRDAPNWNVTVARSEDVRVTDLRIVSARLNSDGINSVNSRAVRVRRCFVRNHDDSIVVKTTEPAPAAEDIAVEDCTVWSDWGYSFGVTYETRAPVRRVAWRRCSVLYARNWCLGIHVSDSATVSDVTFADIEVAGFPRATRKGDAYAVLSAEPRLARFVICRDVWGRDAERGRVRDVTVDGVTVHGGRLWGSEMHGADADHDIRGVTIRGVRLAGQHAAADAAALRMHTNAWVNGLGVVP
jgi:hypothetical protein